MSNIFETETKIKQIIDELKALSAQAGLANQGEEERIICRSLWCVGVYICKIGKG